MPPFVVFASPRSRTAWLSRWLSQSGWQCGHDELRHCRTLEDVRAWLSIPFAGTVETAAAPYWRTLHRWHPEARVVVVRRAPADVLDSLSRVSAILDPRAALRLLTRLDAKLRQIAARWPGAMEVAFESLSQATVCAAVFEHCIGAPPPEGWWEALAPLNLQIDFTAMLRHAAAYQAQTHRLRDQARAAELAALHATAGHVPDSMQIGAVPFSVYFPGALAQIRQHAAEIGEGYDYPDQMNFEMMAQHDAAGCLQTVVAQSNGRVFGYLMTVLQRAFVDRRISAAHHTSIWADPSMPGLGMRMLKASNAILRDRGVGEIIMRAGTRGDGPRLGVAYRRLGAEPCGELYRLDCSEAAA